jgi:hemerythrin
MKWSDAYATGIARIDAQHKMIFKMAEDFRSALDEQKGERVYPALLQTLDVYVRTHFGFEEECMARYNCPAAQGNKEAHAWFIGMLTEYRRRYAGAGYEDADARNLVDGIDKWLADHICKTDLQLKQYAQHP